MNIRKLSTAIIILIAASLNSCKETGHSDVLFPHANINELAKENIDMSSVFGRWRTVQLETTDSSLIGGRSIKMIKAGGRFYVQSVNDIIVFDNDGRFISKLSAVGQGPGEYSRLIDFDVVPRKNEIWVSTEGGIMRYDATSMKYKSRIPLEFFANRFMYIPENESLICLTPEEEAFKVVDLGGKVLSSYFQADKAFSTMKVVGFVRVGDRIVSQIENSNDAVVYDPRQGGFSIEKLVSPETGLETMAVDKEYFERYGYFDQFLKVSENFTSIVAFSRVGKQSAMIVSHPDKSREIVLTKGDRSRGYIFAPESECKLVDNILGAESLMMFYTLSSTRSDDSFIFFYNRAEDEDTEANPTLFEVMAF